MEWIEKGGPVMVPLLALSIYAVAVILYKCLEIFGGKLMQHDFLPDVLALVREGQYERATEALRYQPGAVARVMAGTIEACRNPRLTPEAREEEAKRLGVQELKRAESHLKGLDMTANIAPLLGLLGTVTGMMGAFMGIEQAGARVNPALLAGGIWEALITTVAGLIIAVPATVALYFFQGMAEKLRYLMGDACTQVLAFASAPVQKSQPSVEPVSKPQAPETKPVEPKRAEEPQGEVKPAESEKAEVVKPALVEPVQSNLEFLSKPIGEAAVTAANPPVALSEPKASAETKPKVPKASTTQGKKVFSKQSDF